MKTICTRSFITAVLLCVLALSAATVRASDDPLSSWNEGPAKKSIVDFVEKVTKESSPDFVSPAERIATFDQDGTLWVEHPIYSQVMYCLDRVPAVVAAKPELKEVEPFKTVLSGNREAIANLPKKDLEKILAATLSGMTTDQFQADVKQWLATAKDPRWKRPYTDLTYKPMQEVLQYLRANGFKTYMVTGGGQDFVRVYAEMTYGIPPEQVVGTMGGTQYGYGKDGKPILTKEPKLLLNDNNAGKPEAIHLMIGRRPVAAFGNSPGDQQMLEYTKAGGGARLCMLVLHDDAKREYAYGPAEGLPDTKVGAFPQAIYDKAQKEGWTVISMKSEWKQIFAFDETSATAIDIALEPDATMMQQAETANAHLLKAYSKGFALDASHHPHITLLQRYVRTANLDKVYAAADKVLVNAKVTSLKLKAYEYYYSPDKELGLAGIVIKPTEELLELQQSLIDAVAPFTVTTATAAAFVTTPEDPEINRPTIDYVATFVPKASGKNFNPHVTVGLASQDYLKKMLAEPFKEFTFLVIGASVYHLGNYGTARKELKELELNP